MKNKQLVDKLIEKGYRICAAESCTGGMFSSAIVDVAGSSAVMDMGFVTYANSAKIELLGVEQSAIEQFGVVSETVAGQMAKGAAKVSGAEVAVGISGIAGPGGGSEQKPVGTVCFGFYVKGKILTATCRFGDMGRSQVRKASCDFAIDTLLSLI